MPLIDILTRDEPFGPIDQTEVLDYVDALDLLEYTDVVSAANRARHPLIVGRKGSGKSSLISAYHSFDYVRYRRNIPTKNREALTDADYLISIITWEYFDDMARNVYRDMMRHASGDLNTLNPYVPAEKIESIWNQNIWHQIIRHFYGLHRSGKIAAYEATNVVNYCNTRTPLDTGDDANAAAQKIQTAAKNEINLHLARSDQKCLVLFDSMEEYPINNPVFKATLSGFLRAIKRFHLDAKNVRIIFCLPEEIMPHVTRVSTNILKDFERVFMMRWRPLDLFMMSAHRYRLFLKTHADEYPAYKEAFDEFKELDFREKRSDLQSFYQRLLPDFITNDFSIKENTLAYIVRHTQLLPRHILAYFNEIARLSYSLTGGWRLEADAVLKGIAAKEGYIADEVTKPFEYMYPGLTRSLQEALPNLTPIFEYGKLDKLIGRLRKDIGLERSEYWSLLYRMGIIGRIIEDRELRSKHGGIYTYAEFHFNSAGETGFPTDTTYCLHPVFSRFFGCNKNRAGDTRMIYPSKIAVDFDK